MRRCLSQCANPPLATRYGRGVNLKFLRRRNERRSGLEAGDVRPVAKLGLQVAPKNRVCSNEVSVFL